MLASCANLVKEAPKMIALSIFMFINAAFSQYLQQEKFQPQVCNRTIQGQDLWTREASSKARCVAYCMQDDDCLGIVFNATELKSLGQTSCVMKAETTFHNPYYVTADIHTCYMLRVNISSDFIIEVVPSSAPATPIKIYGAVAKNLNLCPTSSSSDNIVILTDKGVYVYEDVNTVTITPCVIDDFDWLWGNVYSDSPKLEEVESILLNTMDNIEIIADDKVWEFDYGGGTAPSAIHGYPKQLYQYIDSITQLASTPLPLQIQWAVQWASSFNARDTTELWISNSSRSLMYYSRDRNMYDEITNLSEQLTKSFMQFGTLVDININTFWKLPSDADTVLWLPYSSCGNPSDVVCFAVITTDHKWKLYKLVKSGSASGFLIPDFGSVHDFGYIVF